jgi:hypothetical protein
MPSLSRLETSKKGKNVFPLSQDNYEKLFDQAFMLSEQHFEISTEGGSASLRLPKVNPTWSDIRVIYHGDRRIYTTGLTRETFRQVHEIYEQRFDFYRSDERARAMAFIISLLHYPKKEAANDLIANQSILKTVEERLAIGTRSSQDQEIKQEVSQDQEIKQEVSLGSLNETLIRLVVSTSAVRLRLEYIRGKFEYISDILKKFNHGYYRHFDWIIELLDMVESPQKSCKDLLLEVETFEKRINTNITVVRHLSPNMLSPELSTALTT